MFKNISLAYIGVALAIAAPSFAQERFDSADAAAQAVIDAAGNQDAARLAAIFGPQGNAILTSGKPDQDRAEQAQFSKLAQAKHRLIADPRTANRMILSIGDEDWPFPVPLVRTNGKWSFDPSAARVEMRARRIGANELDAIEICTGYVGAQQKYASEDRDKDGILEYAPHMMTVAAESLVPKALAEATWDGQKRPVKPYHGYYFKILTAQGPNAPGGAHTYLAKDKLMGGFALVAWPAEYGVTGIQTFIVNQEGMVYEKDIPPSPGGAVQVTHYDPDPSWKPVD